MGVEYVMLAVGFVAGLTTWAITSWINQKAIKIWYSKQLAQAKLEIYNQKKAMDDKMEKIRLAYPEMTARQQKSLEDELSQSGVFSSRQRR